MFSQTSEYALRVMVFLAGQSDQPSTTHQIAHATGVPEGYLAKVLQNLGHAGFVKSQRGLHGGFVLGQQPANITVYDVIESVDSMPRVKSCPLGIKSHANHLCPLHRRLDHAMAAVEQAFRESTIAELLVDPNGQRPLVETKR